MHLGVANPARASVLIQVLEEPQDDDFALQLRLPGPPGQAGPTNSSGSSPAGWSKDTSQRLVSAVIASRTSSSPTSSCSANSPVAGGAAQTLVQLVGSPSEP